MISFKICLRIYKILKWIFRQLCVLRWLALLTSSNEDEAIYTLKWDKSGSFCPALELLVKDIDSKLFHFPCICSPGKLRLPCRQTHTPRWTQGLCHIPLQKCPLPGLVVLTCVLWGHFPLSKGLNLWFTASLMVISSQMSNDGNTHAAVAFVTLDSDYLSSLI